MINKAITDSTSKKSSETKKEAPKNNRPIKLLVSFNLIKTPEETETIIENLLNRIVSSPKLLEDEKLNAKIEKLFENATFQKMVEATDVFQDISNLSLASSIFQKNPYVVHYSSKSKRKTNKGRQRNQIIPKILMLSLNLGRKDKIS